MNHSQKTVFIIGGDLRQHWLARQLASEGFQVKTYGLEDNFIENHRNITLNCHPSTISPEDIIILPLPISKIENILFAPFHDNEVLLSELVNYFHCQQKIYGGLTYPPPVKEKYFTPFSPFNFTDYASREELTISNAVPTAEGCIQIALERLPTTIQDTPILITGYGHVAKATAKRFSALGAHITITARSSSALTQAKADTHKPLPLENLRDNISNYPCIINTIPALIFKETELAKIHHNTLLIDLASNPGGFDKSYIEKHQLNHIHALSLPGKVAPATASQAIKDCILPLILAE